MSIYNKQIAKIEENDLNELLVDKAVETIRLEFKRKAPSRDELCKKISSFANTYGGYIIIGAIADSETGELKDLCGIEKENNYKQTVIQLCYEHIYPPIMPNVSNPIIKNGDNSKEFYVIYINESHEAPHFMNKRKGIYVRTDEYSRRYEEKLANYEEIKHLSSRREKSIIRRDDLFSRAHNRFNDYLQPVSKGEKVTPFKLAICPSYPNIQLIEQKDLINTLKASLVKWRSGNFPMISEKNLISQYESCIVCNITRNTHSFLELNEWGHLLYATRADTRGEEETTEGNKIGNYIHIGEFVGNIQLFIAHAIEVYKNIGFNGILNFRIRLENIKGTLFVVHRPKPDKALLSPATQFDNNLDFELKFSTDNLENEFEKISKEILKVILYSFNWHLKTDKFELDEMLRKGYVFNGLKS